MNTYDLLTVFNNVDIKPLVARSTGSSLNPLTNAFNSMLTQLLVPSEPSTTNRQGLVVNDSDDDVWLYLLNQLTNPYRAWRQSDDSETLRWLYPNTKLARLKFLSNQNELHIENASINEPLAVRLSQGNLEWSTFAGQIPDINTLTTEGTLLWSNANFDLYTHSSMTGVVLITDHSGVIAGDGTSHFYWVAFQDIPNWANTNSAWIGGTSNGSPSNSLASVYATYFDERMMVTRDVVSNFLRLRVTGSPHGFVPISSSLVVVRFQPESGGVAYIGAMTNDELQLFSNGMNTIVSSSEDLVVLTSKPYTLMSVSISVDTYLANSPVCPILPDPRPPIIVVPVPNNPINLTSSTTHGKVEDKTKTSEWIILGIFIFVIVLLIIWGIVHLVRSRYPTPVPASLPPPVPIVAPPGYQLVPHPAHLHLEPGHHHHQGHMETQVEAYYHPGTKPHFHSQPAPPPIFHPGTQPHVDLAVSTHRPHVDMVAGISYPGGHSVAPVLTSGAPRVVSSIADLTI